MSRYENIKKQKSESGINYFTNNTYPEVPHNEDDIYIITTQWERLDNLAEKFYGNPYDYWIISIANPQIINFGSIYVPSGKQLRIPVDINEIKSEYYKIND